MTSIGLRSALLLCLSVACTHARTTASPRQEERAAQKAEDEPRGDKSNDSDKSEKSDKSDTSNSQKGDTRSSGGEERAEARPKNAEASATRETAARGERDADRKNDSDAKARKDDDEVAPEDIQVATTPQGLLEPGALDKVRDKLGVSKGESVQGALRRFQREHDLPATGMLDQETVERLGLSPDEIFER